MQQPKARMTFRFDNVNKTSPKPPLQLPKKPQTVEYSEESMSAVPQADRDEIAALEELIRQSQPVAVSPALDPLRSVSAESKSANVRDKARTRRINKVDSAGTILDEKRPLAVLVDDGVTKDYPDSDPGSMLYPIFPLSDVDSGRDKDYDAGQRLLPHNPESPENDAGKNVRWLSGGASFRADGPSWWRVFVSVAGAIATGALFGYLVLSLFTGEPLFSGKTAAPSGQTPAPDAVSAETRPSPSALSEQSGTDAGQGSANEQAAATTIAGEAYYLLQYGVFRTAESEDAALEQLRKLGLPAVASTDSDGGLHVYAGIAPTKEAAEYAASMSGVELYVKRLEAKPVVPAKGADSLTAIMVGSADLEKKLIRLTADRLQAEPLTAVSAQAQAELQAAYDKLAADSKAASNLEGKAKEYVDSIVAELGAAVRELADFNEKPAKNKVWKAQTSLMKAVTADIELRQSIHASEAG